MAQPFHRADVTHQATPAGRGRSFQTLGLMKKRLAILALGSAGAVASASPDVCSTYASDLRAMVQVDQALREHASFESPPDGRVKYSDVPRIFQQIDIVDRTNTSKLAALVKACGWPKRSVLGEKATGDAWLLAQHAEPQAQRQFLPFVEAAVRAREASPVHLAYLADRVAVHEARPQEYGTQLHQAGSCKFKFSQLDNPARVDERRQAIGLPSLEEYERMFTEHMASHGCPTVQVTRFPAGRTSV